jgi:uncharacterized protein YjbJ (UPF0337 family)
VDAHERARIHAERRHLARPRTPGTAPGISQDEEGAEQSGEEDDRQRRNRELIELLNELRVALPGVQVLFAFLLTVPFSGRFGDLTQMQEAAYFGTFIGTAVATALLMAPTSYHRIRFRQGDKERMPDANRFTIADRVPGAVHQWCGVPIADLVFGLADALAIAGAMVGPRLDVVRVAAVPAGPRREREVAPDPGPDRAFASAHPRVPPSLTRSATGLDRPAETDPTEAEEEDEMGNGTEDRNEGRWDEAKGRVKEAVGDVTDDEQMEAEGRKDQAKGDAKQALGNVKDAVERGKESFKKAVDDD